MHFSIRTYFLFLVVLFVFDAPELSAQSRRVVRADQAFELKQYSQALNMYRRVYNRVRRKDRNEGNRVAFQAALCYRYLNDHRSAESWFRRVVRANYPETVAVLYFAESLMQNGKFDEALVQYSRYAELVPDDWRGQQGIESVAAAKALNASPTPYEVESLRVFNSREDDLTPVFGDHRSSSLIFASSRDDAMGRDPDPWTGNQHTSFFISYQDRSGSWSRPALLDEGPVNTEFNEGAASINPSATRLYFTRCLRSPDVDMGCRIFVAERDGAKWGQPKEIPLVGDSALTVGHPAISPDELELFFVSDMPGGEGGKDIWVVRRRAPGDTFGEPENLGPEVNTPGNEMFPFVREDGALFFASDGHPGLGGLDIFMSQRSHEGWSEPVNMGIPINSTGDDFGIVFYPGREQGFLSSGRPGSRGYDIYSFYLAPFIFTIQGVVVDEMNERPIRDAVIQLIGSDGSFIQTETSQDGTYLFDKDIVRENIDYDMLVSKEMYFSARGRQSTRGAERSVDYVVNFELQPILDKAIPLPEILYEFASWELLPQFKDSLNGLVQTLKDNPRIVIELASHTDSRGTDQLNDTLSQRRAQTVVDFLIAEGVEHGRLKARGYGKRVPRTIERDIEREGFRFVAGTVLNQMYIESLPTEEHRDAAHQLNRRTEFRVLSDDYSPAEPTGNSPPGNR